MKEIVDKIRNEIEVFLQDSIEHQNKYLDCILLNLNTNEKIIIASDGLEEMIMFTPYTNKLNGYKNGYMNVPDWDFNFDDYLFEKLENDYKIGFISEDMHNGIWNSLKELYPEEIEHKNGVQIYLKYCKDNDISKEYLDSKTKLDTPNIINYYEDIEIKSVISNEEKLNVKANKIIER